MSKENIKTKEKKGQTAHSTEVFEESNQVNWPVKPFVSVKVSNKDSTVLKLENGVKIIIPPGAFVSTDTDSVLFTYRYYNDWGDILFAGIPMKYDSSTVSYNLVSDGMVEIFAESKGQLVNINENVPIEVQIPITDSSRNYNYYRFDTAQQQWNYNNPAEEFSYLSQDESPYYQPNSDNIEEQNIKEIKSLEKSIK